MRILALIICLLIPLGLQAQTATQPSGTIAVDDSTTQDVAIATRIRNILAQLDGYSDVTVEVNSGIVTLQGATLDAETAARLNELVGRVEGVVAIENAVAETTDVAQRLDPVLQRFVARGQQVLAFLPLALVALSVFAIVVVAGFAIARWQQPWARLAPNAFIADIYRQILRLLFVIGGLVIALDILNATALLSGILGAAGIVGLAIGFAVKDTVENFIASVMLSIRQPFRPNDLVEIEGDIGKVIRLTSRATILLSYDGNHIRIPNSTVFKSRIVNFSRNAERRFTFELGVASDVDLAQAQALALDVLEGLPFVLSSPQALVWVESVADSWVNMGMAGWINQNDTSFVRARSEAIRLVQAAFDENGVAAQVPGYRITLENGGAAGGNAQTGQVQVRPAASKPATKQTKGVQEVGAVEDKQLEQIVAQERADERSDLLRRNADQE